MIDLAKDWNQRKAAGQARCDDDGIDRTETCRGTASNSLIIGNSEGNEEIGKTPFQKKFSGRKGIVVT